MGVLTGVYRLGPKALKKLKADPSLFDCVNYPEERSIEELGYPAQTELPHLYMDKSWEDVVRMLDGCGYQTAAKALENLKELGYEGQDWVRFASVARAKKIGGMLASVRLQTIKKECVERELTDWYGKPLKGPMLDYTFSHLKGLIKFWNESVQAEEAVVVASG
jgi:uncharacterized protein DUF1877